MRFPEFSGEWKKHYIRDIATIEKGNGISKDQLSEEGEPCILYGELYTKYKSEIIREVISKTNINAKTLVRSKANDVIIPCSGETAVDIATARCVPFDNILLGGDLSILRFNSFDGAFISYQLNGKRKYDIAKVAQGVSVVHLYPEHLKGIKVYAPTLEEQKKIVHFLSILDERIATQIGLIEDLKRLKSAITEKLYKEIKGERYSYRQLFSIVNERNKKLAFTNILSASQELGMVERDDLNIDIKFDRSNIATYKIVRKGDYVIHLRSFQGGFAFSETNGVCSPAYTILRPSNLLEYGYLSFYFTSKSFVNSLRLVTYGIRDGRSINVDEWLDMKVILPTINEQKRILSIIGSIDKKLANESAILSSINLQRQYLLQMMFV